MVSISPFGHGQGVYSPFDEIFDGYTNPVITGTVKGNDALLLWGGEDIHPSFYGERAHPMNECKSTEPSNRDMIEWHLIREAREYGIPMIGVCRGAQMLCAFAGGRLIQHVTNHMHAHEIKTHDGLSMNASANHHQMMEPTGTEYELLAWRECVANTRYEGVDQLTGVPKLLQHGDFIDGINEGCDPEVLWFPDVRGMAIQPHPEWMDKKQEFPKWIVEQVLNFTFGE